MQKTKILSLAILAALLSSPCAWAAEPTPAAAETAAAQTDTMTTGSTEAAEDETTVYGNASVPMPDAPLDLVEFTAAKMVSGEKVTLADSYAALKNDENIVLVKNGADVTLSHGALNKTGNTTSVRGSKFNGQNAGVLAADATLALDGCTIRTEADGANAVFAAGPKGVIKIHDSNIRTTGINSRGLDAVKGASITADNINIGTTGLRSAALATEPAGAVLNVSKSTVNTSGQASPLVYSKGDITLAEAKGAAAASQIAVVEGGNIARLEYVDVSGSGTHGILLYQNGVRADGANPTRLSVKNSALRSLKTGPLFYVTNTQARIYSELNTLQYLGGELIKGSAGQWGTEGSNGADLTFMANQQALFGNISVDNASTLVLDLQNGSHYSGAINRSQTAKRVDVQLDASSSWQVAGTSYITSLKDADTTLANIKGNGFTVYYDAADAANAALGGKTYELQNGGYLKPVK